MDWLLGGVTVLSLGLTGSMAFILWRLLQAERERSDARVDALRCMAAAETAAAGATADVSVQHPEAAFAFADLDTGLDASGAWNDVDVRGGGRAAPGGAADDATLAGDRGFSDDEDPAYPTGELFAAQQPPTTWPGRLAIAAGVAVLLIGGVSLLKWTSPSQRETTAAGAVGTAFDQSLELLALHHAQEDRTLTISGLVQNPRGGRALEKITATATLFAADGSLAGSGRAPLDFTRLAPGDESPFVVTIPLTGQVARYRVGFRGADGRVIGHVDRRQTAMPVARRQ
ncbi:MAG TPA: hypothetical protein VD833_20270 [Vicinamibacterales bacterium]|nr:hypothetical protein [Vicinamibacterales bacterium]